MGLFGPCPNFFLLVAGFAALEAMPWKLEVVRRINLRGALWGMLSDFSSRVFFDGTSAIPRA
jgi:hypothetical protein